MFDLTIIQAWPFSLFPSHLILSDFAEKPEMPFKRLMIQLLFSSFLSHIIYYLKNVSGREGGEGRACLMI